MSRRTARAGACSRWRRWTGFAKTGPAILFTRSQRGGPGWLAAIESPNVKAIASGLQALD